MTKSILLTLILAVAILSSTLASVNYAFADSDDDQHEGKVNKKNRTWTGDGPPLPKLGKVGDIYINNVSEDLTLYKKTSKGTWTNIGIFEGPQGPAGADGAVGPQGPAGADGAVGSQGEQGTNGQDGLNCWDLNGDGLQNDNEDINSDSAFNALDCKGPKGDKGDTVIVNPGGGGTAGAGGVSAHLFLKLNGADIEGESPVTSLGREDSIQLLDFDSLVETARDTASGLSTGRRTYEPLTMTKEVDKSTPLLYKGLTQNQIAEGIIKFYRPSTSGDGTTEQFFTIEFDQGRISSLRTSMNEDGEIHDEIAFVFQTITWTYEDGGITHTDTWSSAS